jgi:hypothetical protein
VAEETLVPDDEEAEFDEAEATECDMAESSSLASMTDSSSSSS